MTASQVRSVSEDIALQIGSSFQGRDKKSNTVYSTSVLLLYDNDASKGDFYLEFVNNGEVLNKKTQKSYPSSFGVQGSVNQKDGNTQMNRIQVQSEADDIIKTGAHEIGHTGGLEDPDRGNKGKDKNGLELSKDNLMNQGNNKGEHISIEQLKHIEKTIDEDNID